MSADIILFVPRSNPKADRAFWIGPEDAPAEEQDFPAVSFKSKVIFPDTPAEYVAPQNDPA